MGPTLAVKAELIESNFPEHPFAAVERQGEPIPGQLINGPFLIRSMPSLMSSLTVSGTPPYQTHPHHRNGMAKKAQWKISESEEKRSFVGAWQAGWHLDTVAWGLHLVAGEPQYLGVVADHQTKTFFAKFVRDPTHPAWHGYPANQKNRQDVPDLMVARMWINEKHLSKAKIRKIIGRQTCQL